MRGRADVRGERPPGGGLVVILGAPVGEAGPEARGVEQVLPDRTKRRKTFRSEKEAALFDAEVQLGKAAGLTPDPRRARVALDIAFDRWVQSRTLDLKAKTLSRYRAVYRLRVSPVFGAWPVGRITRDEVQRWLNGLDVTARVRKEALGVLYMVLALAVTDRLIPANPCDGVRTESVTHDERPALTFPEVESLAQAVRRDADGGLVRFLAYTGCRWSEVVGLRVADVDLDAGRLHIRRAITATASGALVEGRPKTAASLRRVPIPPMLISPLRSRVSGREASAALWAAPGGGLLRRENWVRDAGWDAARRSIGHPTLRIHDLRHTYASLTRAAGADLKLVSAVLGHASVATTGKIYSHLFDDELDRVSDALATLSAGSSRYRQLRSESGFWPTFGPHEAVRNQLNRV